MPGLSLPPGRPFHSDGSRLPRPCHDETIDQLLLCGLTGSHALLVGVPGLAKTLMVKALAAAFEWKFCRIRFTPDVMPSDITGYELLGRLFHRL